MYLQSLLNAAATDGQTQGGGLGIGFIILYVVFFVAIIYFLFVKPSKKQQAQQEELQRSVKVGSSIMTTSGFYGTIIGIVDEDTVIVEFGNNKNCRIPMHKKAIAEIENPETASAAAEEPEDEEEEEEKEGKFKLGKKKK